MNTWASCQPCPRIFEVEFNQQGLKKFNDLETKEFLRGTNHRTKNLQAFEQLLSKKNRREYLEDEGYARTRRQIFCSNCKTAGHIRATCLRRYNSSQQRQIGTAGQTILHKHNVQNTVFENHHKQGED